MQQNILIISFNNLGQSFWNKQLNTESQSVCLVRRPESIANCLKKYNPDIIIVDTYFAEKHASKILDCFKELEHVAMEKLVFHFSPEFSINKTVTVSLKGVFQTVLSNDVIDQLNLLVNPISSNNLTA